jgi:hypothetical protein
MTTAQTFRVDNRETDPDETPADEVPSVDQETPTATYQDWRPEDTRVLVFTSDPGTYKKDLPCVDGADAIRQCVMRYGRVLEVRKVPDRYFIRVRRAGL